MVGQDSLPSRHYGRHADDEGRGRFRSGSGFTGKSRCGETVPRAADLRDGGPSDPLPPRGNDLRNYILDRPSGFVKE
jgi:hypothetical protein